MIVIAPVRRRLVVKASQSRAFTVFTAGMSRWWPATHSILKSPLKEYYSRAAHRRSLVCSRRRRFHL
jgi:hypothetical protein